MKKRKNVIYKKSVSLLAAAAMTAVLMTGQIYPVVAQTQIIEDLIETSSLIPDNITIDEPVALSQVSLPKSEYGTLQWADESYVPEKRVQSCEVIFKPAKSVDLSYLSGWDEKEKVVKGKVTVVVTSIDAEESDEIPEDGEVTVLDPAENGKDKENTIEENTTEENTTDNSGENAAEDENGSTVLPAEEESEPDAADGEKPDSAADKNETEDSSTEIAEIPVLSEVSEEEVVTEEENAENKVEKDDSAVAGSDTLESIGENSSDETETSSEIEAFVEDNVQTGTLNEAFGGAMPGATILDGDETPSDSENTPASEEETKSTDGDTQEDAEKNIFDNPLDFSTLEARTDTAEDNLTEEEQAARAAENHSCEGISVSGIDLPWYVQFQVSSGESYEFKNEEKASIFQAYEFKLWDLKNNTEYEIPDGQYVSVTIPVKEGYEYSIEHLLDNGATETIVPSVNGSTMVFSTHSFSPFGIAGFYPIIGGEIADNAYGNNVTPTPTPTPAVSGTPTPSPGITGTAGTGSISGGTGTTDSNGNSIIGGTTGTGNGTAGGNQGTTGGTASDGTGTNSSGTTGTSEIGNVTGGTAENGSTAGITAGNSQSPSGGTNASGTDASGTQSSNAVKTGDNTVILPFIILIAAAIIVVIIIVVVMIRKKDKEN